MLDGIAQGSVDLACSIEAFRVQAVEGHQPHAHGAAGLGQTAPPTAHLQLGRDDDAGDAAQARGGSADEVQHVGGLAGGGRGEIEMDCHRDLGLE